TSRNPYNFILFQPGVSGHPNPELGIPRTINTNGLTDRINYQMDGMVDTESDRHGLRLFPISDTFVREVQTVSNSFAPEFGGTAGDIYNVITQSGTNDLHGSFLWLHRWQDATAYPILSKAGSVKPELKLNDYSANAGGKVIKDKLFWFGAYEQLTRGIPAPVTITSANAAAIGIPPTLLAAAPGLLHGKFVDVRGDWVVNSKNTAFLRYNYFSNDFPFNTNVGGLYALDAGSDFKDRAHVIGMQLVTSITSNLLNEFRFSWPLRSNSHFAGSLTGAGPAVEIPGIARFNGTTAAGDRFVEKIPNFNENFTWIHGKHTMKFGGAWQANVDLQQQDNYTDYFFPSVAAYLGARSGATPFSYSNVNVSGGVALGYHSHFYSFYGQDSWQVTPRLMMIYGVRYDKFDAPPADRNAPLVLSRNFNSPSANFAPRLGLAYKLNDKTVLRASSGIFYDAPATNTWYNTLLNNGSIVSTASIFPTAPGAPSYPSFVGAVPAPGTPQDVFTTSPHFRNAYTINANLQLQRELGRNDAITVGYIHSGGRNLEYLHNINLINPIGALADGRPVFAKTVSAATRLYPQFNNITDQDTGANSSFDAGTLNYTHRLSRGIQMSASYTYSHTITDAPEANGFEQNGLGIEDTTDLKRDRGNSYVNRPHALTMSTIFTPTIENGNTVLRHIVNDNMFAFLTNISSGDQQNITANTILNGDAKTSGVTRPLFVGRNTVRGPNIYQIDLRYTRTFATLWERVKPQFIMEANNLFNHPNVTSLNTVAKVDSFGNITTAPTFTPLSTVLEGRIVQFGLAVRF
ncbi:MAG: TonB-dependent receptor, partial [Acidobacteriaceae bacterium]